jgi:hypothetical protein
MNKLKKNKLYKVELQVIILKIGHIETKNEQFYAEFYLEASWIDKIENFDKYDSKKHFNPNISIRNSIGDLKQDINYSFKYLNNRKVQIWEKRKIEGRFWQKFDFSLFPIDQQTLHIEISTNHSTDCVHLVDSIKKFNCLSPNAFMNDPEWKLDNFVQAKESNSINQITNDVYSSYTILINASRISTYYIYNAFLLIFLITSIGLTRFTVTCDLPHVRLIIDTTVNLTLITFKWVITSDLPQISYLTFLDVYSLITIIFINTQSIYDSIIGSLAKSQCEYPYSYYDLIAFIISLSLIGILFISFIVFLGCILSKNRIKSNKLNRLSMNSNSQRLFNIYNNELNQNNNGKKLNNKENFDSIEENLNDTLSIRL